MAKMEPTEIDITVNWTVKNGRSNASDEYIALVGVVADLIRNGCGQILEPHWIEGTARLIVAQLAHVHNVGPLPDPGKS